MNGTSASSSAQPSSSPPVQVIHCTQEVRNTLQALTKKWKKKPALNLYTRTSTQSAQQRQHTNYYVHNGSISYKRSYIKPPENAQSSRAWEPSPNVMPDPFDDYGTSDIDVAPSSDDVQPYKKPRTAGVSVMVRLPFQTTHAIQDHPLLMWLDHRSLFLEEMLRLEGRGGLREAPCSSCGNACPQYRCQDCFGVDLRCSSCITVAHQRHPLHRLQVSMVFLFIYKV